MNTYPWLAEFGARLEREHILAPQAPPLGGVPRLAVDPEDWGRCAREAAAAGLRWAGMWADQRDDELTVTAVVARGGDHLVLTTVVPLATPLLTSHAPWFPGADRLERHAQDLLGIAFTDHPDPRRWTRHRAWSFTRFPLRADFPLAGDPGDVPPDAPYRFVQAQGTGVHEIPVGPVHAGIIEPGHFRFHALGEDVLLLEERLGYVHKGIEKTAVGRDPAGLARLAGRVSGDSTVAHAWAACMALEQAAGVTPPPRALALRAVMLERERVANHLGDIGAICNDVGFAFAHMQFSRLRELWQRDSLAVFGHRLMMDRIVPGGIAPEPKAGACVGLCAALEALQRELDQLMPILSDYPSLEDRLVDTGVLTPAQARRLGCVGPLGRASGQDLDLRRDRPTPPYDGMTVTVPVLAAGDVMARLQLRAAEIRVSLGLLETLLTNLPDGPVQAPWPDLPEAGEGLGAVEGWRGETLAYLRLDAAGRVARYFPRDPSWFAWPALEQLILGNIVPDFPVCNKSVNGSYAGHDL